MTENSKKHPTQKDRTLNILESIQQILEKQNRLRTAFLQGVVRGLGTALGATVVVAILTSLAIALSSALNLETFLDGFFG